jgi:hypothetical protein
MGLLGGRRPKAGGHTRGGERGGTYCMSTDGFGRHHAGHGPGDLTGRRHCDRQQHGGQPEPVVTGIDGPRGVAVTSGGSKIVYATSDGSISEALASGTNKRIRKLGQVPPGFIAPAIDTNAHGGIYVLTTGGPPGTGARRRSTGSARGSRPGRSQTSVRTSTRIRTRSAPRENRRSRTRSGRRR